ncbi:MAG TPA: JAB domain-containing protein [Candidatus Kapabacteria bacterium]|nr:JAB domain-containing protein [Candidatus Kapabacteria bacterium]
MQVKLTEKQKIIAANPDAVYQVMREILLWENEIDRDQEHFWCICLNSINKILNIELISLGSIDETIITPMQVFRIALQKGAVKLILVHNHPSGMLVPSSKDIDITDRMIQVGLIHNIEVCDHLIISPGGYYAFSKKGLLEEIRGSKKYVPLYIEKERIRNEGLKLGRTEGLKEGKQIGLEKGIKEGEKKGKIEIAGEMKKNGIAIDIITKITRLSKKEIEQL